MSAQATGAPEEAIKKALQNGQLDLAHKLVQKELKTAPQSVQWRFMEGVIQAQQGQVDKAIDTFQKITQSHPEQSEAYNNLGVLFAAKGQLDEAKVFLERALQTHPSYAAAHRNLSDVHSHLAKQNYAKALQADPKIKANSPQLTLLGSMGHEKRGVQSTLDAAATQGLPTARPQANATPKTPPSFDKAPAPVVASAPLSAPAATSAPAIASVPSTPPVTAVSTAPTVPASAPAPASAKAPKLATEKRQQDSADIDKAVQAWAKAWSNKDMARYYAAYASSFTPANRVSRAQWENDRRLRIVSKSSISVEVRDLKITIDGQKASVRFTQRYSSDNLKNSSRKTLDMVLQGKQWMIVRESVN